MVASPNSPADESGATAAAVNHNNLSPSSKQSVAGTSKENVAGNAAGDAGAGNATADAVVGNAAADALAAAAAHAAAVNATGATVAAVDHRADDLSTDLPKSMSKSHNTHSVEEYPENLLGEPVYYTTSGSNSAKKLKEGSNMVTTGNTDSNTANSDSSGRGNSNGRSGSGDGNVQRQSTIPPVQVIPKPEISPRAQTAPVGQTPVEQPQQVVQQPQQGQQPQQVQPFDTSSAASPGQVQPQQGVGGAGARGLSPGGAEGATPFSGYGGEGATPFSPGGQGGAAPGAAGGSAGMAQPAGYSSAGFMQGLPPGNSQQEQQQHQSTRGTNNNTTTSTSGNANPIANSRNIPEVRSRVIPRGRALVWGTESWVDGWSGGQTLLRQDNHVVIKKTQHGSSTPRSGRTTPRRNPDGSSTSDSHSMYGKKHSPSNSPAQKSHIPVVPSLLPLVHEVLLGSNAGGSGTVRNIEEGEEEGSPKKEDLSPTGSYHSDDEIADPNGPHGPKLDFPIITRICDAAEENPHEIERAMNIFIQAFKRNTETKLKAATLLNEMCYSDYVIWCVRGNPQLLQAVRDVPLRLGKVSGTVKAEELKVGEGVEGENDGAAGMSMSMTSTSPQKLGGIGGSLGGSVQKSLAYSCYKGVDVLPDDSKNAAKWRRHRVGGFGGSAGAAPGGADQQGNSNPSGGNSGAQNNAKKKRPTIVDPDDADFYAAGFGGKNYSSGGTPKGNKNTLARENSFTGEIIPNTGGGGNPNAGGNPNNGSNPPVNNTNDNAYASGGYNDSGNSMGGMGNGLDINTNLPSRYNLFHREYLGRGAADCLVGSVGAGANANGQNFNQAGGSNPHNNIVSNPTLDANIFADLAKTVAMTNWGQDTTSGINAPRSDRGCIDRNREILKVISKQLEESHNIPDAGSLVLRAAKGERIKNALQGGTTSGGSGNENGNNNIDTGSFDDPSYPNQSRKKKNDRILSQRFLYQENREKNKRSMKDRFMNKLTGGNRNTNAQQFNPNSAQQHAADLKNPDKILEKVSQYRSVNFSRDVSGYVCERAKTSLSDEAVEELEILQRETFEMLYTEQVWWQRHGDAMKRHGGNVEMKRRGEEKKKNNGKNNAADDKGLDDWYADDKGADNLDKLRGMGAVVSPGEEEGRPAGVAVTAVVPKSGVSPSIPSTNIYSKWNSTTDLVDVQTENQMRENVRMFCMEIAQKSQMSAGKQPPRKKPKKEKAVTPPGGMGSAGNMSSAGMSSAEGSFSGGNPPGSFSSANAAGQQIQMQQLGKVQQLGNTAATTASEAFGQNQNPQQNQLQPREISPNNVPNVTRHTNDLQAQDHFGGATNNQKEPVSPVILANDGNFSLDPSMFGKKPNAAKAKPPAPAAAPGAPPQVQQPQAPQMQPQPPQHHQPPQQPPQQSVQPPTQPPQQLTQPPQQPPQPIYNQLNISPSKAPGPQNGHQKPNLPLLMTEGNGFDGDLSRGSAFSNPGVGTPSNASRSASRPMSPAGDGGILDLIKEGETDYFGNSGGANQQNWGQAGGAFDF